MSSFYLKRLCWSSCCASLLQWFGTAVALAWPGEYHSLFLHLYEGVRKTCMLECLFWNINICFFVFFSGSARACILYIVWLKWPAEFHCSRQAWGESSSEHRSFFEAPSVPQLFKNIGMVTLLRSICLNLCHVPQQTESREIGMGSRPAVFMCILNCVLHLCVTKHHGGQNPGQYF